MREQAVGEVGSLSHKRECLLSPTDRGADKKRCLTLNDDNVMLKVPLLVHDGSKKFISVTSTS